LLGINAEGWGVISVGIPATQRARLDGVIQIGTTFTLPEGIRYVTLEDMMLRQSRAFHPYFGRISARVIGSWEERRTGIYERARMCAVASHWAAESLLTEYGLRREPAFSRPPSTTRALWRHDHLARRCVPENLGRGRCTVR
jgi:hypothetical protein